MLEKKQKRYRRHKRVRAKIFGTSEVPRLCVFRSNKHIYTQLIDDERGKTLVACSDTKLKNSKLKTSVKGEVRQGQQNSKLKLKTKSFKKEEIASGGKIAIAYEVGKLIAEKAIKKKIKQVVFDRGGYKYHGRVKALAEGAREGGLKF